MSAFAVTSRDFVREQLRAPLTRVLLVAIPVFFVLIFASVLGEFAKALGGTLPTRWRARCWSWQRSRSTPSPDRR